MDNYEHIWDTIESLLDKAQETAEYWNVVLVGDYNRAFITDGVSGLLDDYLEGTYSELDIDRDADYSDQYEQMKAEIKKGCRFGDYQEIIHLATRIDKFKAELTSLRGEITPGKLVERKEYDDLYRVWINGRRSDLSREIKAEVDELDYLDGYLDELADLEYTSKEEND